MPRTNFPFARHPIEGVPHGASLTVGPNPFDGPKGRNTPPSSPTTANLHWWGDANDTTTLWQNTNGTGAVSANNDPVGDWHDKNGSLQQLEQATAGNRPLYKTGILNGKAGLKFDGTSDIMLWVTGLDATIIGNSTVIMVLSGWTTGTQQCLIGSSSPTENDAYSLFLGTDDKALLAESGVSLIGSSDSAYSTSGCVLVANFAQSATFSFYNGLTANGSGAHAKACSANSTTVGSMAGALTDRYTGYIHEILIYSSVLNTNHRESNVRYLKYKWSIA